MTWLKGTSTWGNICSDIIKLACGEMADGSSITCATGDRWVRHISTAHSMIRPPASQDVTSPVMANRGGYFNLMSFLGMAASTPGPVTPTADVCQQTAVWTGAPTITSLFTKWIMAVYVNTTNSVSNNYSTASLSCTIWDAPSGSGSGSTTTVTPNAAGVCSWTIGGKNITFNVSNPVTGKLTLGTYWTRCFTTTYLGGIDDFGPLYKRHTNTATFSISPVGASVTDWDVVDIPNTFGTMYCLNFSSYQFPYTNQGAYFSGLGHKTNTALTGARYTYSFNWTPAAISLTTPVAGQIQATCFGHALDDAGTFRPIGGYSLTAWLQPFNSSTRVRSGSLLQYWLSVKADSLFVIINGDPGDAGQYTFNWIGKFTPWKAASGPSAEVAPWITGRDCSSNTAGDSTTLMPMMTMNQLMMHTNTSYDGSSVRDWQTGWSRMETTCCGTTNGPFHGGVTKDDFSEGEEIGMNPIVSYFTRPYALVNGTQPSGNSGAGVAPTLGWQANIKPDSFDGKWEVYGTIIADSGHSNNPTNTTINSLRNVWPFRGYIGGANAPFQWVPSLGWVSGDEVTDTVTGKKYFCLSMQSFSTGTGQGLLANLGPPSGLMVLEQ